MDNDDQRDYAEESYWRNYCPNCDSSPCIGQQCLDDIAESDERIAQAAR